MKTHKSSIVAYVDIYEIIVTYPIKVLYGTAYTDHCDQILLSDECPEAEIIKKKVKSLPPDLRYSAFPYTFHTRSYFYL